MPMLAPSPALLRDGYQRAATDLRLSITDRCNLRCGYCLPEGSTQWIARDDLLTVAEIRRLVRLGLEMGIQEVRLTGGEPLVRPDLEEIVAAVREAFGQAGLEPRIALTTNAVGLAGRVDRLVQAGLGRINISLDTLDPERFRRLTGRDQFDSVMAGIEAAAQSPLNPVKLNSVILNDASIAEVPDLVRFALQRGLQWRAIEFMPLGPLATKLVDRPGAAEIMAALREAFEVIEEPQEDPSAPAHTWMIAPGEGHPGGRVGVIASNSNPFCRSCSRTRLSANGRVYPCLFSPIYVDILSALRSGAGDGELKELWQRAMAGKPAGRGVTEPLPAGWRMSQIGG